MKMKFIFAGLAILAFGIGAATAATAPTCYQACYNKYKGCGTKCVDYYEACIDRCDSLR